MNSEVLKITTDQRYYYMVVLKGKKKTLNSFKDSFNDLVYIKGVETETYKLTHLIYNTNIPLHQLPTDEEKKEKDIFISEKSIDRKYLVYKKKYAYDCLLVSIKDNGVICILAPYFELLIKLKDSMIKHYNIESTFLTINIFNFINEIRNEELVNNNLTIKATGIGASKRSTGDLSHIIIKGNKPLSTEIGKLVYDLLQKTDKAKSSLWQPSICRIKSIIGRSEGLIRINLSLNTDKYGNYKLYLQKGCINILSLIAFIDFIMKRGYYLYTSTSPTNRIILED